LLHVFKKKKVKGRIYYDLVKNHRKGVKVMHERLMYVGNLCDFDDSSRKLLLLRVESLLLNQFGSMLEDTKIETKAQMIVGKLRYKQSQSVNSPLSGLQDLSAGTINDLAPEFSIQLSTLKSESHRSIGSEWLCHQAISELGILPYLQSELGWSLESIQIFELSLLGRLIHRGSERSTANWLSNHSGSEELQSLKTVVHRESLRLSALCYEAVHTKIEAFVYARIDGLLKTCEGPSSLEKFYYDLSNVYFEGRMQGSDLARYGRSKEKRNDQPIISYGLLTNEQGIIKQSNIYAGNVHEADTFEQQIQALTKETIFFCDAGIATQANIEYLLKNEYHYMCVARAGFSAFSMDLTNIY